MDYLHTIIMGLVQGLTEFLPVSSSGHIVLTSVIYKLLTGADFSIAKEEEVLLDIMLHFGTLLAILLYFKKEVKSILISFYEGCKNHNFQTYDSRLSIYIIIGTIFTCLIVYPIKDYCETLLGRPHIVGILLVITGLILFVSEFLAKRNLKKTNENDLNNSSQIDFKKAILIGIAQGFAAFPGISRSGTTIATALALGTDRANAARYSFLLSIPIILMAVVYKIPETFVLQGVFAENIGVILTGTLVAAIVGYFCIKYFIAFLNKFSLNAFGYYCVFVGIIVYLYFSL